MCDRLDLLEQALDGVASARAAVIKLGTTSRYSRLMRVAFHVAQARHELAEEIAEARKTAACTEPSDGV